MLRGIKGGIMLSVCVILMFFYGCSSGGGGGSSGSNNVSSSGTSGSESNISTTTSSSFSAYSYYKFYIDNNSSSLYAVDPNNPTSPIYVDNIDKANHYDNYRTVFDTIWGGQYDASTYTIFNVHKSYIIYSKNGLIYKLPTDINAALIPTQVSNLNATICDLWDETGNVDPDLDFISVETAGADGVCYGWCATTSTDYSVDNQHYLVRLDMSSTDAPIAVSQDDYIDDYYYNFSTGNIGGVFIDNNGTYEACDKNLANCITLNATDLDVMGDYPGKVYLCINGTEIYSFDKTSKALTWIYTLPYDLDDYVQNGNNIYFDSNSTIYKLDTTSNTLSPLYTDILPIDDLYFTDNKIVYITDKVIYTINIYGYNIYDYTVKILDNIGGVPTTIFSLNSTTYFPDDVMTTGNKIIIPTNNATIIYDENGNLLQTFNGTITGVQYSNSGSMLSSEWPLVKIIVDNNVTSTLNAISMSDLSITTMTQSLPTDIVIWKYTSSLSNIFLITGGTNINYPYQSGDIFFFDTSKANSFIRVTNTPDNEFSLWSW